MPETTDVAYARVFADRREGHAFYSKVSGKKLKPGTVGYFDVHKDWQPIIQLQDLAASAATNKNDLVWTEKGLTPLPKTVKFFTDGGTEELGTITSDGVNGRRIDVDIAGKAPDGSAGGGAYMQFTSSVETSAVLATEGKATHHQSSPQERFREWMVKNINTVISLSDAPKAIKKKGIWIVTKTWTVKRCSISLMRSKDSEVSFGIDANAYGAKVSPSAGWWNSQKGSDWRPLEDPSGVVVFMSGIWWRSSRWSREMQAVEDRDNQKFLSSGDGPTAITVELPLPAETDETEKDDVFLKLQPYAVGKDPEFEGLSRTKASPLLDEDDLDTGNTRVDEDGDDVIAKDDDDFDNESAVENDDDN